MIIMLMLSALLQIGLYGRHVMVFEAYRLKGKRSEKLLPESSISNGEAIYSMCKNDVFKIVQFRF